MRERTNEEWLSELQNVGKREEALADLRAILLRGLQRGLTDYVRTSGPEFQPLAEDFTQEALLKILANLDTFKGNSKFTTWAHKIAIRVALTELRRARWKNRSLDEMTSDETPYVFAPTDKKRRPDQMTEQGDLVQKVLTLIEEELTDKQRQAMELVPMGGLPIEVAAQQMGMKRNAMYKLIHDARVKLKSRLEEEGMNSADILASFT